MACERINIFAAQRKRMTEILLSDINSVRETLFLTKEMPFSLIEILLLVRETFLLIILVIIIEAFICKIEFISLEKNCSRRKQVREN